MTCIPGASWSPARVVTRGAMWAETFLAPYYDTLDGADLIVTLRPLAGGAPVLTASVTTGEIELFDAEGPDALFVLRVDPDALPPEGDYRMDVHIVLDGDETHLLSAIRYFRDEA